MTPGMKRRLGNACFADRWSHAKARSREGKCASLCSVQGQASRGRESAGVRSFCERRRQYVAPGHFRTRLACWQLFEIAWRRLSAFRCRVMCVLQTAGLTRRREVAKGNAQVCVGCLFRRAADGSPRVCLLFSSVVVPALHPGPSVPGSPGCSCLRLPGGDFQRFDAG